jgi:AcrR family transcriptional regulator
MITESSHASKRDEIVAVASKLFYEQGYHQTGVQQIIQVAGVAKGTFYGHFKSKEALGVAWLRARHVTWNRWLNDFLAPYGTPREKILGTFDFLKSWMADSDYRGCAFLNTLCETPEADCPLREEIASHKCDLLETFVSFFREMTPERAEEENRNLAKLVFLLFEGALIEMQNYRASWPAETARRHVESLL